MSFRRSVPAFLAGLICSILPVAAQSPGPTLRVTGSVAQALTLTAADLAAMPRATVSMSDGSSETLYGGVWLHDILRSAGVPMGIALEGPALATYVLAEATDGHRVVFSIAELDPSFADNEILVADTLNGEPLGGREGRFRIVTPLELRGARSVRMLETLEVVQLDE